MRPILILTGLLSGLLALAACEAAPPATGYVAADGTSRDPGPALAACEPVARQAEAGAGLALQTSQRGLGQAGPLAGQVLGPSLVAEARAAALADCMAGQGFQPDDASSAEGARTP